MTLVLFSSANVLAFTNMPAAVRARGVSPVHMCGGGFGACEETTGGPRLQGRGRGRGRGGGGGHETTQFTHNPDAQTTPLTSD